MGSGFRGIVVQDRRFRWRFNGRIVIVPAERSGSPLYVDWGWKDWLEPEGTGNEPSIVTPGFVAEAIRFALEHGWKPERDRSRMELGYSGEGFFQARQ